MKNLIENLKNLSTQILYAKKLQDYNKIIELDQMRKKIIDKIFSKGIKVLSEENIETIKSIAEENENIISEISIASSKKIETANKKMKALTGYKY